jgi:plasmid replication initiation protein
MAKKNVVARSLVQASELLKKSVSAIHTSGDLSLLERKTANVLLLNAYQHLITRRTHKLPVTMLCAMLGYDSNDIDKLKNALKKLATTAIEFNVMKDGKESWKVMSMLSFGEIENGVCSYRYDEYLAERLYDPEIYATINLAVQRKFDSGYALTLYENCLRYKAVGSTGWWDIERFRSIMGATASMYDEFKYLKREVVTKPIEHINRVSDLRIEPEFQKTGRKITGIRFQITESPQQTLITHEATDEHAQVREHPTYKRLIEHGIGDKLALFWVMGDEQRAQAVIDYVENKDRKNQVKGSTAGYIRKLIEDKAEVGGTAYEQEKQTQKSEAQNTEAIEAKQKRLEELKDTFKRTTTNNALKALTKEQTNAYATTYIQANRAGDSTGYDSDKAQFKDKLHAMQFSIWLRQTIAPAFDEAAFRAWLKTQNNATQKG